MLFLDLYILVKSLHLTQVQNQHTDGQTIKGEAFCFIVANSISQLSMIVPV